MGDDWKRRRILIWGKTRPEASKKHKETVCTGGVFEDTKRFVRLYPIPLRYMDDDSKFKKYQWITAEVRKSSSDLRPESFKIRCDGLEIGEMIETKNGNWDARADWILTPSNCVPSVEALQEAQQRDGTSLGIIKPAEIRRIHRARLSEADREEYIERIKEAQAQPELSFDPDKGSPTLPLSAPDFRFKVEFRCDDSACSGHDFSVLDWEVDALYARFKNQGQERAAKLVEESLEKICSATNDTRFFLGNMASHPQTFTIVGTWRPKDSHQPSLF